MNTASHSATEPQIAFILSLTDEVGEADAASMLWSNFEATDASELSTKDASAYITLLKKAQDELRKQERKAAAERRNRQRKAAAERRVLQEAKAAVEGLDEGVYAYEGDVFRVYPARQGGHLLAKRFNPETREWDYLGAASRFVSADMKMPLEDAMRFGLDFGICVCCARALTDPDSINAGIGPVCKKRHYSN